MLLTTLSKPLLHINRQQSKKVSLRIFQKLSLKPTSFLKGENLVLSRKYADTFFAGREVRQKKQSTEGTISLIIEWFTNPENDKFGQEAAIGSCGVEQSTISGHLKKLTDNGLIIKKQVPVEGTKRTTTIYRRPGEFIPDFIRMEPNRVLKKSWMDRGFLGIISL